MPSEENAGISPWPLAVVVTGVILAIVVGLQAGGASHSASAAISPENALARRFAPLVYLHSKDSFRPMSADTFVHRAALKWRRKKNQNPQLAAEGQVQAVRLGHLCGEQPQGCYQDGPFSAVQLTRPHETGSQRPNGLSTEAGFNLDLANKAQPGDKASPGQAPIYYEIAGHKEIRITYWFFYGYNRPDLRGPAKFGRAHVVHEGDWENIDVVLSPNEVPKAVDFYGHGKPVRRDWSTVCKWIDDHEDCNTNVVGHPIAYSAKGTHASYASRGSTPVCVDKNRLPKFARAKIFHKYRCADDKRDRGVTWQTWAVSITNAEFQPWYGFGGAWGEATEYKDGTGPLGPSSYKRPGDLDSPLIISK